MSGSLSASIGLYQQKGGARARGQPKGKANTRFGLSVVLEFVSAHNGTVEIVDGEFPGAHFRIIMPISATTGDQPVNTVAKAKAHARAA